MTEWGPGEKHLANGKVMVMRKSFRLSTGDTMHWAECTDGWTGQHHVDDNDAEKDFGEHLGKQQSWRLTAGPTSDCMQRKLGTVGVDQDIRIDCNHYIGRRCSTVEISSTAALLLMSTVGIRLPRVTGRSSRNAAGCGSAGVLRRVSIHGSR